MENKAQYICQDAGLWLLENTDVGCVFTSLPDADEVGMEIPDWQAWFKHMVHLCIVSTSKGAPCIFYQTDRKKDNRLVSKCSMLYEVANKNGANVIWHKIAMRKGVDSVDLMRPTYTHMIAFGDCPAGKATPCVINRGPTLYKNGIGTRACRTGLQFAKLFAKKVVDPFCGRGTIPHMAAAMGLDALGIDIDPAQIAKARALTVNFKGMV